VDLQIYLPIQAIQLPLALGAYLGMLALAARVAPTERVGFGRHLAASYGAIVPVAFAVAGVPAFVQWLDVGVRYQGSLVAKGISELVSAGLALALSLAWDAHRRSRAHEAQALQLEASLAEARLRVLASQLHPHFLFNTINAISVMVHRDPRAADAMLVGLADLLRATLQQRDAHEIPLRDELALLDRYLDIMRLRFGPRLLVEVSVASDAGALLVPPFVLQPLVENALEHGIAGRAGPGTVRIDARRVGDRLRLEVTDDGAGLTPTATREGIGLSTTRRRLEQLYGAAQRLQLEPAVDGHGARATVDLPARLAGPRAS
jgi:LytS/YehU family sensor histidine kinase